MTGIIRDSMAFNEADIKRLYDGEALISYGLDEHAEVVRARVLDYHITRKHPGDI